jgi:hypothetical protein
MSGSEELKNAGSEPVSEETVDFCAAQLAIAQKMQKSAIDDKLKNKAMWSDLSEGQTSDVRNVIEEMQSKVRQGEVNPDSIASAVANFGKDVNASSSITAVVENASLDPKS